MALSDNLQLRRCLSARHQHHPGDPGSLERDSGTPLLTSGFAALHDTVIAEPEAVWEQLRSLLCASASRDTDESERFDRVDLIEDLMFHHADAFIVRLEELVAECPDLEVDVAMAHVGGVAVSQGLLRFYELQERIERKLVAAGELSVWRGTARPRPHGLSEQRPVRVLIRADGAARGNPGPASAGAVIIDASRFDSTNPDAPPVAVIARPLGIQTNNFAEYMGVILALEKALGLGARQAELVLDSKLIVEQLSGRWKVKHPGIKPLVARAHQLLRQLDRWSIRHERRELNRAADALANLALDDPVAARAAEAATRV